ncbi:hypothetical protein A4D02_33640 [Niastella koreensis]|uniref:KAP P-loop domain protein n=2 Tax=Niastella koreensis TaxID=354356 RepID=G8TAH4_NIAKG|nr:KAP P-loop domain-containing protein [Niastella koreensis]AEV98136.1 KAP P-loop domain protein [Niastella koreensis GR20-10]OQP45343.1 hypothetical protein A4D02_33640 [Niastella koreensis]
MIRLNYTFTNQGLGEYNDHVFPGVPFQLKDKKYRFTLQPTGLPVFLRFGIALSKTEEIDFAPQNGRYNNANLKFIEVHQGDLKEKKARSSNKLEIDTYYFSEHKGPRVTFQEYERGSIIDIWIQYDPSNETLRYKLTSGDNTYENNFSITGYNFFKIFAWADYHEFNIDVQIEIETTTVYRFPKRNLSNKDIRFLNLLYENFAQGREYDSVVKIPGFAEIFPGEFNEKDYQPLIQSDRLITLWGIWHINPGWDIFLKFDEVILSIKFLMQTNAIIDVVRSSDLQKIIPGITLQEIKMIFKLMSYFVGFSDGGGTQADGTVHIKFSSEQALHQYRKYRSLQEYLNQYLERLGITNEMESDNTDQSALGDEYFFKTQFYRQRLSDIEPVLGVKELAADMAAIIYGMQGDNGQMIGVFGKWGRGKTYFIKQLWKELKARHTILFEKVEYQAWKYQDTPASWAYLYERLCDAYLGDKKNFLRYYARLFVLNRKRVGWTPVWKMLITIIATASILVLISHSIKEKVTFWVGATSVFFAVISGIYHQITKNYSTKAIELIKKYTDRSSFKASLGIQADIHEELVKLLKVWIPATKEVKWYSGLFIWLYGKPPDQVLLVVEDLDRCAEDKIIPHIDALRVMLENDEVVKRLIIITAIDERILRNAIRKKYHALLEGEISNSTNVDELISEYLDKLFISAIKLGDLNNQQKEEYLKVLFKNDIVATTVITDTIQQVANDQTEAIVISQSTNEQNIYTRADAEKNGATAIPAKPDNKTEKLTPREIELLTKTISNWEGATPRRISIFYYRYLLCKNLLVDKYARLNIVNPWQGNGLETLFQLIRQYHDDHNPDKILIEARKVHKQPAALKETFKGKSFVPELTDYLFLLEVLEIVIAY